MNIININHKLGVFSTTKGNSFLWQLKWAVYNLYYYAYENKRILPAISDRQLAKKKGGEGGRNNFSKQTQYYLNM